MGTVTCEGDARLDALLAAALAIKLRVLLRQSQELARLVADLERENDRCDPVVNPSLRAMPGLGAVSAPAIYAERGDSRRFTDADQLVALAGVDPPLQASVQPAGQAKLSNGARPIGARRSGPPCLPPAAIIPDSRLHTTASTNGAYTSAPPSPLWQ